MQLPGLAVVVLQSPPPHVQEVAPAAGSGGGGGLKTLPARKVSGAKYGPAAGESPHEPRTKRHTATEQGSSIHEGCMWDGGFVNGLQSSLLPHAADHEQRHHASTAEVASLPTATVGVAPTGMFQELGVAQQTFAVYEDPRNQSENSLVDDSEVEGWHYGRINAAS